MGELGEERVMAAARSAMAAATCTSSLQTPAQGRHGQGPQLPGQAAAAGSSSRTLEMLQFFSAPNGLQFNSIWQAAVVEDGREHITCCKSLAPSRLHLCYLKMDQDKPEKLTRASNLLNHSTERW